MAFDIAVVDAEATTRRHVALALAPIGYRVASFADAASAISEIIGSPPRLVIADLLLPGPDGFDLFQQIRSALGDRVELLCITGVQWGQLDLGDVLARRFRAPLLRKPFLKSELKDVVYRLIGTGRQGSSLSSEWRIGVEDASRVEDLSRDFEVHIARVGVGRGRCSVRRPFECKVLVKKGDGWIECGAKNISEKGVFVETRALRLGDWPQLDEMLEVSFEPGAIGQGLRARGRVAFRVTAEEAAAQATRSGFGMEFMDLADEDRHALHLLVGALREENDAACSVQIANSNPIPITWVLLAGIEAQSLLRRPGFLHRQGIEIMSVTTMDAAVDFAREHPPALCVIHEGVLGAEPGPALAPLTQCVSTQRVIVLGHTSLSSLIAVGFCDTVLRSDMPVELLLEEVRERLGVSQRRSPRVPAQAEVKVHGGPVECQGNLVNLSTGGMLLRTLVPAPVGCRISVHFDLLPTATIQCDAIVVRCQPDDKGNHLWGLAFSDVSDSTFQALSSFVKSHVQFREFFTWLKAAYFDGRIGEG